MFDRIHPADRARRDAYEDRQRQYRLNAHKPGPAELERMAAAVRRRELKADARRATVFSGGWGRAGQDRAFAEVSAHLSKVAQAGYRTGRALERTGRALDAVASAAGALA